ncbi:MAG: 5-formyltetrahydrofolate cyclo-ligase, partial [Candidatus Saccharimonadales bacterium]
IKPVLKRLQSQSDLKIHILGQARDTEITTAKFDLILVPVLAFDKENYRLGWGGGFYDKFLANQPQALKIGLGFQDGLVEQGLPHEPHDVPLDKVITEV